MKCEEAQPLLSKFVDRELVSEEPQALHGHLDRCLPCAQEVRDWRRLARMLAVPPGEIEPDPAFVLRFREHRDVVLASTWLIQPWKRLAVRLVPLAAAALVVAGLVLGLSGDGTSTIRDLEHAELSYGLPQATEDAPVLEPVLGIAVAGGSR